jgi:MtaA/CmuA family methyltransferase
MNQTTNSTGANSDAMIQAGSRALVHAALAGGNVARTPVGPLAVHYCAAVAGNTIRQYTLHARLLAESILRYYERFQPDVVWISADTWVSAQAMGATVDAEGDDQPFGGIGPPRIQTAHDIDRLPAAEPGSQGRYPLMLEALTRVVEQLGQNVFIVGCFDQYPFSLAAALVGINEIMVKVIEDPPFVAAIMERCVEYGAAYARAMSDAGVDMLSGGDSPVGLIGPRLYRETALPFERRLIAQIKAATRKPVSLHICGRTLPILEDMASSGADVLEVDHHVDLAQACRLVSPDLTLWGNLDPVSVLARASAREVRDHALRALAAVKASGHPRFVLSSGCALAMETPPENLDALLKCEQ